MQAAEKEGGREELESAAESALYEIALGIILHMHPHGHRYQGNRRGRYC